MRRAYVLGVGIRTFGKYPSQTLGRVEMFMRDTKIGQIYQGTNQIQRVLIARGHFGDIAR